MNDPANEGQVRVIRTWSLDMVQVLSCAGRTMSGSALPKTKILGTS